MNAFHSRRARVTLGSCSVILFAACSSANKDAGDTDAGKGDAKETATAEMDLPSCHWPASLNPGGGQYGSGVTRAFLVCGGQDGGATEICPSDDGVKCVGSGPQLAPCVEACAADQYAVELGVNTATGAMVDAGALPSGCGSVLAAAQNGIASSDDGPSVQCCPCQSGT